MRLSSVFPAAATISAPLRLANLTAERTSGICDAVSVSSEENDNVYFFYSAGLGIGHYKLSDSKDRAPELLSYLHVTRGPFENFRKGTDSPEFKPLRWAIEGRLKIPESPMQIGLDANLGQGPDSVAFVFATRFDIGEVFGKLRTFTP